MCFAKWADMPSRPLHRFASLLFSLLLAAPLSVGLPGLAHAGNAEAPASSAALPVANAPSYAPASSGIPVEPAPQARQPPPQAGAFAAAASERGTEARFGIDGTVAVGPAFFVGGSARYESASPTGTSMVLRAAYYRGAVVADEGGGFRALSFGVGFRAYSGVFYIGGEGALLAYGADSSQGTSEWNVAPNGTGMAGVKLGPVDASIHLMFPLASIGLSLGTDFAL